jgi:hypothetical protein
MLTQDSTYFYRFSRYDPEELKKKLTATDEKDKYIEFKCRKFRNPLFA